MPYTVDKADQLYGLQLTVAGLKPKAGQASTPLLDGSYNYDQVRSNAAGAIHDAMLAVALVEFCRAEERLPALKPALQTAQNLYMSDLLDIFDDDNFKDRPSQTAYRTSLLSSCNGNACSAVVSQADFDKNRAQENFTTNVWTIQILGGSVMNVVKGEACDQMLRRSTARASDATLVALGDTGNIIGLYLEGGQSRVAAKILLFGHAKTAHETANATDLSQAAASPQVQSCLSTAAQTISSAAPGSSAAAASAPSQPAAGAGQGATAQPAAPTSGPAAAPTAAAPAGNSMLSGSGSAATAPLAPSATLNRSNRAA